MSSSDGKALQQRIRSFGMGIWGWGSVVGSSRAVSMAPCGMPMWKGALFVVYQSPTNSCSVVLCGRAGSYKARLTSESEISGS